MANTDITLFDIATSADLTGGSPSPFVWRVRLSLHYKKLPYTTVWTQIDEIEATCKAHDIPLAPEATRYTLPCLIDRTDPNNVVRLMDSRIIVEYLERTYPNPPLNLSDEGARDVEQYILAKLIPHLGLLLMRSVVKTSPPNILAYMEKMTPARFGMTLQEAVQAGGEVGSPVREGHWEKVREGLEGLGLKDGDKWLNGGEEPTYKDFVALSWIRQAYLGGQEDGWPKLINWNGGKWKKYWEGAEQYM